MTRLILIAALAVAAGCATKEPDTRYPANVKNYDQERRDRDAYDCQKDAMLVYPETAVNQYTADNRRESYLQCLKARGYEIRSK